MKYLLQISIGPVQDFISAARRTRDLWFGSTMLSEIAKSVALSVKKSGGGLIFPAPESDEDLKVNSKLNVANVILAEFESADCEKLKAVSDEALKAAKERLKLYADNVWDKMSNWIVKDRWESQLDDIIEFYSAWVPMVDDYLEARKKVAKLLAARKNIRNFAANKGDFVPKSSLDGLRESVLIRNLTEEDLEGLPDGVQLKPKESLDAIGLIKRVPDKTNKDDKSFASVIKVALNSWERGKGKRFMDDPAFRERYNELLRDDNSVIEGIAWHLGLEKEFSAHIPDAPYLAFLCADGDRMGAALSAMKSADEHREFSRKLSSFALKARNVIKENHGSCVYTGGDDVLAFLPLDTVLKCARELHDLFGEKEIMGNYGASLSVGVSIAHAMEDLAQLLDYGRTAEGIAKKGINNQAVKQKIDRNGLAISVRSRGNIPFTVREQWKDKTESKKLSEKSLDERIDYFAKCFVKHEIPVKFPYELRENAGFYKNWEIDDTLKNAVIDDVTRIFKHKDIKLDAEEKILMNEYIKEKVHDPETIKILADELILAQWIASGMSDAELKDGEKNEVQSNPD